MEIGSETFGEFGSDLARILLHEALFQPDVAQAQGSQRRCARRRQASESDQRPIAPLQDGGGRLVPVVTARELTLEGAGRGLLALTGAAQLRFPPNPFYEMPCALEGRTLACAPKRADAERAERELATATTALVRVTGMGGGTAEPLELRLSGTAQALARVRQFTPPGPAQEDAPGISGREAMDRLRQLFGR